MRVRYVSVFFGMVLVLASGVTWAQNTGLDASGAAQMPMPKPPIFPTLFPHPTNNNGYEEWVRAVDLIQNNAKVEALDFDVGPSLTLKRQALNDPVVVQALLLLRAGLNKPVYSPRTAIDENTLLPELAGFRRLARLLRYEEYVAFADGRVDAAIGCLRTGLGFGYRVQTDNFMSGLVGVAIHSIMLKEFSQHLDQLSAYHCDDVRRIVEGFLSEENPAVHLLALEKINAMKMLEAHRSDVEGLFALLRTAGVDEGNNEDADGAAVRAHLLRRPADVNAVLDNALACVSALYDQTLANMRLPLSQRKPVTMDKTDSPGAALFRAVTGDPEIILKKYTRDQSQLRMLGVHALVHRYRWEHNALPSNLTELSASGMVKDAFTGSEIVYRRDGDRYTLTIQEPVETVGRR